MYYDLFIAKWNTFAGTTQQKLDAVNADVSSQPVSPLALTGPQVYNAIVPAEFAALSAADKQNVRDVFGLSGQIDVTAGTNARAVLLAAFGAGTATRANLAALATKSVPWWQANGYPSPFNSYDVQAAGVS